MHDLISGINFHIRFFLIIQISVISDLGLGLYIFMSVSYHFSYIIYSLHRHPLFTPGLNAPFPRILPITILLVSPGGLSVFLGFFLCGSRFCFRFFLIFLSGSVR